MTDNFTYSKPLKVLKRGIWLYFLLLIFEGALRKWVLPSLATPLLIVRDPVALFLLFYALVKNIWRPNQYVIIAFILIGLSFIATLVYGHGNVIVALYGLRIMCIHFPLMFLIGSVLTAKDVHAILKILLFISIGMLLLVALQFFSPQSAWVNRGIGGDLSGSGFSGAAGFYRVPGTFSFTNGLSLFYGWVAATLIYYWGFGMSEINKKLLYAATLAFVMVLPLLISRTVVFETVISFLFFLAVAKKTPSGMLKLLLLPIALLVMIYFFQSFGFFSTATNALVTRFENASNSEGGFQGTLIDRFLGGMYAAIMDPDAGLLGAGLGLGSNAGAQLLTGKRQFLVSEGEWGRLIGESGVILGFLLIVLRSFLTFDLLRKSWTSAKGIFKNALPYMMFSFGFLVIIQGQWSQPTSLGFATLIGGIILASLKKGAKSKQYS